MKQQWILINGNATVFKYTATVSQIANELHAYLEIYSGESINKLKIVFV